MLAQIMGECKIRKSDCTEREKGPGSSGVVMFWPTVSVVADEPPWIMTSFGFGIDLPNFACSVLQVGVEFLTGIGCALGW